MNLKTYFLSLTLALVIGLSSCVTNEESDGVLAIRQAQAALLQAKADYETAKAANETTVANAEAAYQAALTAYQEAQTAYQEAKTAYQELLNEEQEIENAYDSAENELELARLEAQYNEDIADYETALYEAQQELAKAQITWQKTLAEEQEILEDYLEELEAENAIENNALETYIMKYQDLAEALYDDPDYAGELIDEQYTLSNLLIYDDDLPFDTEESSYDLEDFYLAGLEKDLADEQEMLDMLNALDLSSIDTEIEDIQSQIDALYIEKEQMDADIDALEMDLDAAQALADDAEEEMDDALDMWYDAVDLQADIDDLSDESNDNSVYIESDDIDAVDEETDYSEDYYYSLYHYDVIILNVGDVYTDEEVADATAERAFVVKIITYWESLMTSTVAEYKAAYYTAEDNYESLQAAADAIQAEIDAIYMEMGSSVVSLSGETLVYDVDEYNYAYYYIEFYSSSYGTWTNDDWGYEYDLSSLLSYDYSTILGDISLLENYMSSLEDIKEAYVENITDGETDLADAIEDVEMNIIDIQDEIDAITNEISSWDEFIAYYQEKVDAIQLMVDAIEAQMNDLEALIEAEIAG